MGEVTFEIAELMPRRIIDCDRIGIIFVGGLTHEDNGITHTQIADERLSLTNEIANDAECVFWVRTRLLHSDGYQKEADQQPELQVFLE